MVQTTPCNYFLWVFFFQPSNLGMFLWSPAAKVHSSQLRWPLVLPWFQSSWCSPLCLPQPWHSQTVHDFENRCIEAMVLSIGLSGRIPNKWGDTSHLSRDNSYCLYLLNLLKLTILALAFLAESWAKASAVSSFAALTPWERARRIISWSLAGSLYHRSWVICPCFCRHDLSLSWLRLSAFTLAEAFLVGNLTSWTAFSFWWLFCISMSLWCILEWFPQSCSWTCCRPKTGTSKRCQLSKLLGCRSGFICVQYTVQSVLVTLAITVALLGFVCRGSFD